MNLIDITNLVYKNCNSFVIKNEMYCDNIFTESWLKENKIKLATNPGWYWLSSNIEISIFKNIRAKNRMEKGCDIPKTVTENLQIFDNLLINKTHFYNGHAKNARARLRNHFFLKNKGTGALGLNAYPELKNHSITVSYFTVDQITTSDFTEDEKDVLKKLTNSNIGRTAIENTWRASNGFPILCKH